MRGNLRQNLLREKNFDRMLEEKKKKDGKRSGEKRVGEVERIGKKDDFEIDRFENMKEKNYLCFLIL